MATEIQFTVLENITKRDEFLAKIVEVFGATHGTDSFFEIEADGGTPVAIVTNPIGAVIYTKTIQSYDCDGLVSLHYVYADVSNRLRYTIKYSVAKSDIEETLKEWLNQ